MPRLFTAIELAPEARTLLEAYQAQAAPRLDPGGRALRLMPAHQFHITLVFLGYVDPSVASRVETLMSEPLDAAPFTIATGSAGVFPARGVPRVWWLGVEHGAEDLTRLFHLVASRLVRAGVALEGRGYRPHVTLGRWRDGRGPLKAPPLPPPPRLEPQAVASVTLFESRLHKAGAEHIPLLRTPLH